MKQYSASISCDSSKGQGSNIAHFSLQGFVTGAHVQVAISNEANTVVHSETVHILSDPHNHEVPGLENGNYASSVTENGTAVPLVAGGGLTPAGGGGTQGFNLNATCDVCDLQLGAPIKSYVARIPWSTSNAPVRVSTDNGATFGQFFYPETDKILVAFSAPGIYYVVVEDSYGCKKKAIITF